MTGRGATSSVFRARRNDTGDECAIKRFDLKELPEDFESRILKEIATLSLLDHPNIVKLFASFLHGDELWMVMPLISGGSVLDILRESFQKGVSEEIAGSILHSVLLVRMRCCSEFTLSYFLTFSFLMNRLFNIFIQRNLYIEIW